MHIRCFVFFLFISVNCYSAPQGFSLRKETDIFEAVDMVEHKCRLMRCCVTAPSQGVRGEPHLQEEGLMN